MLNHNNNQHQHSSKSKRLKIKMIEHQQQPQPQQNHQFVKRYARFHMRCSRCGHRRLRQIIEIVSAPAYAEDVMTTYRSYNYDYWKWCRRIKGRKWNTDLHFWCNRTLFFGWEVTWYRPHHYQKHIRKSRFFFWQDRYIQRLVWRIWKWYDHDVVLERID